MVRCMVKQKNKNELNGSANRGMLYIFFLTLPVITNVIENTNMHAPIPLSELGSLLFIIGLLGLIVDLPSVIKLLNPRLYVLVNNCYNLRTSLRALSSIARQNKEKHISEYNF